MVLISLLKFLFKAQLEVAALGLDVISVQTMDKTTHVWGLLEMFNSKPVLANSHEGRQVRGLKLI